MRSDRCEPRPPAADWAPLTLIELIGTPGAGKTTLSREIVDLLRSEGVDASTIVDVARDHAQRTRAGRMLVRYVPRRWRSQVLWLLFYALGSMNAVAFLREQPRLNCHVLRVLRRSKLRMVRRIHVWFWFLQLGGRQRLLSATARAGEALVVDDGFLHRSVHLYAEPADEPAVGEVAAYVDLLREPQLVVRVVAGHRVCEQRVRRRGLWRHSRNMTMDDLSRYLVHSDHVVCVAARRARERGWIVIDVDNREGAHCRARPDLVRALYAGSVLPGTPRLELMRTTS